ncbi:hypothetical protein JOE57_001969 [Microlunatus panaciterrae]|uniref:DUF2273 domain-containing protein n=1 Tax=Microlunatus panaciterrae TaxID=400768 RepID=A0ABS2RJ62_9ACTN|nr:hypothetical protein [Microlunatus panaciterrae]MBM7799048.1 hypothetical protein [Microlunatus panaciterrae]
MPKRGEDVGRPFCFAVLGLVLGAGIGIVIFALTAQVWWFGLFMLGLVVGALIDQNRGIGHHRRVGERRG